MYNIDEIKNKIICGDCLEELKKFPDNSIDTIITDPPYNLVSITKRFGKENSKPAQYGNDGSFSRLSKGFMGKEWDGTGIAFNKEVWEECFRVVKPGATLMAFGGTRTYHRLACAIEDAGWQIFDCIFWIYGSGFPKSLNIGQAIDKDACRKQLTEKLGRKPTKEEFEKEWKDFRKVIGYKEPFGREGRSYQCEHGSKRYKESIENIEKKKIELRGTTEPATPEAKQWENYGTALKPAVEPIVVARKPIEGTYAENALKWGVSGLNIDECRIQFRGKEDYEETVNKNRHGDFNSNGGIRVPTKGIYHGDNRPPINYEPIGRFPANLILSEEAAEILDQQSGVRPAGTFPPKRGSSAFFGLGDAENRNEFVGQLKDKGGASRFFYVAKASRAERNAGCEGWYEIDNSDKYNGKFPCSKADRFKNNHPTVKPLKLMEYLCLLTRTPTGGIILDPFAGSGTTCIAAKKIGRDFIGIEREADYCAIARARIKVVKPNLTLFQ